MSEPLPGTKRKRPSRPDKRPPRPEKSQQRSKPASKRRLRDPSPEADSDDEIGPGGIESDIDHGIDADTEESDNELTPEERRRLLAKEYIEKVKQETRADYEFDAADVDRDIIAQRLQEDVAESKGKVYKRIADSLSLRSLGKQTHHKNPVTCVCLHGVNLYTACKNGVIEKWDITDLDKPRKVAHIDRIRDKKLFKGHTDDVLSMTLTSDGKFLATGGTDRRICIWQASTMTHLKTFTQHRGPIMSLACRPSTNQIYSSSADRTIKLWSANDLMYIETLFGHQDSIPAIASFSSERCVSVGARDRSARVWKIVDETQLVFQVPGDASSVLKEKVRSSVAGETPLEAYVEGSMDCIAVVDEQHFVTGSDNGDIILWALNKKKPQYTKRLGHGVDKPLSPQQNSAETSPPDVPIPPQPRWITCLASVPYTDLFFSGSWDGKLGVWKVSEDLRKFELVEYIETGVRGVINAIAVEEVGKRGADGVRVVLGIGAECRLGRWKTVKGGRNCAVILSFGLSR